MKKIVFKIKQNTKALILGLSLFGVVGIAATLKKTSTSATTCVAFIGLVATFKKNKAWEAMDENSQKFAEGMDVVLKDLATSAIDEDKLTEKLADFEKKHAGGILTADQKAQFEETLETVSLTIEGRKLEV